MGRKPKDVGLDKIADAMSYDVQYLYYTGVRILNLWCLTQNELNVYIAAFAAYFRNVYDFLFHRHNGNYVRAVDFFDHKKGSDERGWADEGRAPITTRQYEKKANTEVLHISKKRCELTDEEKVWRCGAILAELAPLLRDFVKEVQSAASKKFSDKYAKRILDATTPFVATPDSKKTKR